MNERLRLSAVLPENEEQAVRFEFQKSLDSGSYMYRAFWNDVEYVFFANVYDQKDGFDFMETRNLRVVLTKSKTGYPNVRIKGVLPNNAPPAPAPAASVPKASAPPPTVPAPTSHQASSFAEEVSEHIALMTTIVEGLRPLKPILGENFAATANTVFIQLAQKRNARHVGATASLPAASVPKASAPPPTVPAPSYTPPTDDLPF